MKGEDYNSVHFGPSRPLRLIGAQEWLFHFKIPSLVERGQKNLAESRAGGNEKEQRLTKEKCVLRFEGY